MVSNVGSEESSWERSALLEAGLVLTAELSLPAVLQKIINMACTVADARYGALGVVDTTGKIEEFITQGVTEDERRMIGDLPVGKGILGVLIEEETPLRLQRIQDDPRSVGFPPNHPAMSSFLGVPVSVRGRVYGNLYLTEKRGAEEFSKEDEGAVVTLASFAGVAIENARLYEQARARQRRLEASGEVTRAILEGRSVEEVLGLVARLARELVSADIVTVAIPEGDELVIRIAEGEGADALLGTWFPVDGSISGELMETGAPVILLDASSDERVPQPMVRAEVIGPAMFLPLAAAGQIFGTLALGNLQGGRRFHPEDLAIVGPFADQAAVALDYARIRGDLERLAVLEDRERIAKDLHDGVIQSLFAVGMSIQATAAAESQTLQGRLEKSVEDIDRVIRDLRNYIFGLGPDGVADMQLERGIGELVDEYRRNSNLAFRTEVDSPTAAALASKATDVVQATREAISNSLRHAEAESVSVILRRDNGIAFLEVEDDGRGFDQEAVAGAGNGLRNLRKRAEALGGTLAIRSEPGKGTLVRLSIPL